MICIQTGDWFSPGLLEMPGLGVDADVRLSGLGVPRVETFSWSKEGVFIHESPSKIISQMFEFSLKVSTKNSCQYNPLFLFAGFPLNLSSLLLSLKAFCCVEPL